MKKIRTLKAEEIEVRTQSVKNNKANMLLYINSRSATDLLDETYGMENWMIEYKDVAGQIYGRLSVYDKETDRWVVREDTGSESNIEAEKGLASDILKRCIVRLGVTELYTSPKIQWDDDKYGNTGYKVSEIEYDSERRIIKLVIVNRFGKEAFRWEKGQGNKEYPQRAVATPQTPQTQDALELVVETDMDKLKKFYQQNFRTMTEEEQKVFTAFKDYYKRKIEENSWKGEFNVQNLWLRWRNNNLKSEAA